MKPREIEVVAVFGAKTAPDVDLKKQIICVQIMIARRDFNKITPGLLDLILGENTFHVHIISIPERKIFVSQFCRENSYMILRLPHFLSILFCIFWLIVNLYTSWVYYCCPRHRLSDDVLQFNILPSFEHLFYVWNLVVVSGIFATDVILPSHFECFPFLLTYLSI